MPIGGTELLIILLIVLVLFGRGRIAGLAGEMGEAIANFRKGVQSANNDEAKDDQEKAKN